MLKNFIIFFLILSLIFFLIYSQNEENDSLNLAKKQLFKKPICCVQILSLSNNLNIAKDNLIFGCCVGSPITGSILVSAVGFVLFLIIGIFEVIFTLGQSKTIINSLGNIGVPFFVTLIVISGLLSLLSIFFVPYYDYYEKEIKKSYKNFMVLIERGIGCVGSVSLSLLSIYLILKNNSTD